MVIFKYNKWLYKYNIEKSYNIIPIRNILFYS